MRHGLLASTAILLCWLGAATANAQDVSTTPVCSGLGASAGACHQGSSHPIDITESPYNAVCDGVTDASAAVASAYATGRGVYIPATTLGCVFGDLTFSGPNAVYGDNSKIVPLAGASYMMKITGRPNVHNLQIQDTTAQGQTSNVVSVATVSSGGTFGATSLVVTGATGPAFQLGQRLNILMDDGSRFVDYIASVSGTTINWTTPLPYSAAAGNKVWASFGLIYVTCGANLGTVRDISFLGNWTGMMVDCPTSGSMTGLGIDNIQTKNGNLFGVVCGRGCSANQFMHLNFTGGWVNALPAFNGDGVTRTFNIGPERIAFPAGVALVVKVNGALQVLNTDFTVAPSGQSITFVNTAPPSGTGNVTVSWRVWSAEGITVDTIGGTRASGDTFTAVESGQADTACAFIGNSGGATAVTDTLTGSLCGPAGNEVLRLDSNSALHLGNVELGRAPVAFKIVNNGSGYGDLRATLATAATLTTGYTGVPYVIDPTATYLGMFVNLATAGFYTFANGVLQHTTNTTLAASQSGGCTTSGTQAAGTKLLDCSATSGTLAQLELSASNTSIPAWDTILGVATGVTSCSNAAAGTHTCITLSDRTTGIIANGVTLSFAGPTQPAYLSYKNALPNGSTLYNTHVGSPFTFVVPAGAHHLSGTLWGAGGGGGAGIQDGAGLSASGGAGGGAGARVPFGPIDLVAAATISCTVTIGTGGASGVAGGATSISCNGNTPAIRNAGGGGLGGAGQLAAVSVGGASGTIGASATSNASAGVFSIAGGSGVAGATPAAPGIAGAGGGGGATGTGGAGSVTEGAPSGGSAGGGCLTGTAVIGAQGAASDLGRATHGIATNAGLSATGAGASGSGGAGGDAQIGATNGDAGGAGGWPGAGGGGGANNCNGGAGTGGAGGAGADGGVELIVN